MEKIDIAVIPLLKAFVIVPAVLMRQVLPYAPLMPAEGRSKYVPGSLIIRSDKLDVVDLDSLAGGETNAVTKGEKLVWLSSLERESCPGFIIKAAGLPRFMTCREMDITERAESDHPLIARYVQVRGMDNPDDLPVFILELFNLEKEITG